MKLSRNEREAVRALGIPPVRLTIVLQPAPGHDETVPGAEDLAESAFYALLDYLDGAEPLSVNHEESTRTRQQ